MISPKIPVAREGYPFIGLAAFASLIFGLLEWTIPCLLFFCFTAFSTYFFRDPERIVPDDDTAVLSPADGQIIVAEKVVQNNFLPQENCIKISIFMNVFNVHVNRAPFSAKARSISHVNGTFYSADSTKGGMHNEHCCTLLENADGVQIAVVQIAGLIARRIVNWLEPEDTIHRGYRFGLIRFGSRVDLYLPTEAVLTVSVGDKVKAGESILANLPESE
jgi:phosphatidylserine decarboxylase